MMQKRQRLPKGIVRAFLIIFSFISGVLVPAFATYLWSRSAESARPSGSIWEYLPVILGASGLASAIIVLVFKRIHTHIVRSPYWEPFQVTQTAQFELAIGISFGSLRETIDGAIGVKRFGGDPASGPHLYVRDTFSGTKWAAVNTVLYPQQIEVAPVPSAKNLVELRVRAVPRHAIGGSHISFLVLEELLTELRTKGIGRPKTINNHDAAGGEP